MKYVYVHNQALPEVRKGLADKSMNDRAADVIIGKTGDVHDARTGEWLGTLTN